MKMSRNELRRMIVETVLREQDESPVQGVGAGAVKMRDAGFATKPDYLRSVIEDQVKDIVNKIAGKEAFSGMIRIGRGLMSVKNAAPEEMGVKIEKALKDDYYLNNFQKDILKIGHAFKITVKKDKNSDTDADVKQESESQQAPPTSKDPVTMSDEDPYEYQVNQNSGCWETKKKGSEGLWISLGKNAAATNTLDQKFPDARTVDQKKKCKPVASTKSASGSGQSKSGSSNKLTAAINSAIDNNILSVTTTNKVNELNSEVGLNVAFNVSDLQMLGGALGRDTYPDDQGYLIIRKQKTGQGGPDNLIIGAAILQIKEDGTNVLFLGPNAETKGSQIYNQIKLQDFGGQNSTWGANLIAPDMLLNIVKKLNSEVAPVSESLSRGSLIRQRYWGRY